MLAELVVWAGVSASPEARQLGFARAAVSLWSRRRRCAQDWASHEDKTRAFALAVASGAKRHDTLWILGGGTLADLPLAALSPLFRQIVVFDIALLASARRAVRQFGNVELRCADVTGIVSPLTEWRPGMPLPIPSADAIRDLDPVPPDAVLSLNLLSQLPLQPSAWLQRRGVSRTSADGFGRAILRAHLEGLAAFDVPVGLVTDRTRYWRNRAGELVIRESAVLDAALPEPEQTWHWPLAPRGEIDPELSLEMEVMAARVA